MNIETRNPKWKKHWLLIRAGRRKTSRIRDREIDLKTRWDSALQSGVFRTGQGRIDACGLDDTVDARSQHHLHQSANSKTGSALGSEWPSVMIEIHSRDI
jgi:hypothetical protein